jgi:hypothetical protein
LMMNLTLRRARWRTCWPLYHCSEKSLLFSYHFPFCFRVHSFNFSRLGVTWFWLVLNKRALFRQDLTYGDTSSYSKQSTRMQSTREMWASST